MSAVQASSTQASPDSAALQLQKSRRKTLVVMAILLSVCLIWAGYLWWRASNFEQTDNAYVGAHVSVVSSRIAGVATKVLVADNQRVQVGDVMVELDSADQGVRVEQIEAQVNQIEATILQADAQIVQAHAESESSLGQVARAEVEFKRASADAERFLSLSRSDPKAVSKMELDAAVAARDSAEAELRSQKNQLRAAKAKTSNSEIAKVTLEAQRKVLAAQLKEAQLQLSYNKILAPVSGRAGRKSIEVGARTQPGQSIAAVVQDGIWVTANFKETQLAELHVGQKAKVSIDAFPGQKLIGHIESFSPASGAQFSLLPPDNATGNFTKIVQRVPVKIVFNAQDIASIADKIAPGMSAQVEVDLRQGKPAIQVNKSSGQAAL